MLDGPQITKKAPWKAPCSFVADPGGSVVGSHGHGLHRRRGLRFGLCLGHQARSNVLIDLDEQIELLHIGFEQDAHALVDDETPQTNHVLAQLGGEGAIFLRRGGEKDRPQLAIVGERFFNHTDRRVPVLLEGLKLRGCLEQGARLKLALT